MFLESVDQSLDVFLCIASAFSMALFFDVVVVCVGFVLALTELVLGVAGTTLSAVGWLMVKSTSEFLEEPFLRLSCRRAEKTLLLVGNV